jgi:hypothetical protein
VQASTLQREAPPPRNHTGTISPFRELQEKTNHSCTAYQCHSNCAVGQLAVCTTQALQVLPAGLAQAITVLKRMGASLTANKTLTLLCNHSWSHINPSCYSPSQRLICLSERAPDLFVSSLEPLFLVRHLSNFLLAQRNPVV